MASYDYGKDKVIKYIMSLEPRSILDVGACDGKWSRLLKDAGYKGCIEAVEIFKPNADRLGCYYDKVYNQDIYGFEYRKNKYDVVIFGDVIEHMTIISAQDVLAYALKKSAEVIVGVPYQYKQGMIYGNPWERHIQDDLTHELFMQRYPGFERMFQAAPDYAYYHREGGPM